jgi:signal transduction histidine kinase
VFTKPLARTFTNWASGEQAFLAVTRQIQLTRHSLSGHWAFGGGDGRDREGMLIVPGRGTHGEDLVFRVSVQRHEDDAESAIIVAQCEVDGPRNPDASAEPQGEAHAVDSSLVIQALFNALPIGVTVRNELGELIFANEHLVREEGARAKGIPGADPTSASKEWVRRQRAADGEVLAGGPPLEYAIETAIAGALRCFQCVVFPLPTLERGDRRVATLIIDITRMKLLEIEAHGQSERRRKFLEVQRQFISMVSHEFRTPMTTIHGAQYLLEKLLKKLTKPNGADAENVERWLGLQTTALATLRKLVDQVLMLNRTEHMTGETSLELFSPGDVLTETVDRINDSMDPPRVLLLNEIPAEFAAYIDPALVKAAAENLISNGLKYSADKERVRVRVSTEPKGWVLEVIDRGIGIPAEDHDKLFRPFFRAGNVGSVPGTGLGLAIVRRAVDFHGGQVEFESDLKSGTRFELHFPNIAQRRVAKAAPKPPPLIDESAGPE